MQHLDVNIRRKNNEVLLTVVRAPRPGRDASQPRGRLGCFVSYGLKAVR